MKFDYMADGRIVGVRDAYSSFNEPSVPIPAEVTGLIGLRDEMIAGHRIDEHSVSTIVEEGRGILF